MGFGASVLATLIKTKIKRNLYYEIKERCYEERAQGMTITKMNKKVKVYGYDETKANRELLMGILRDRMDNHKAKFISPIIYNELCTLEVKKNGRIEHSSNAHDDQIFSYLLALYIWYEGKDLMERYGLQKGTVTTDEDVTVEMGLGENLEDISQDMSIDENEIIGDTKSFFEESKSISYKQWQLQQEAENRAADEMIKNNPRTREAWHKHNHLEDDGASMGVFTIPSAVFDSYYEEDTTKSELQKQFESINDLR